MKYPPILFEDDYFVILDKPANLLSTPDRFRSELPSLKSLMRKKYGEIFVLHRLDLETSGCIAFGKKPEIQQVFTEMQINNEVTKHYTAIVDGVPHQEKGVIDLPLIYDGGKTYVNLKDKKAKQSITHYQLVKTIGQYSIIECNIKSGRTHQIRVHLAHIGLPLAVDRFYGRNEAIYLSEFKKKKYWKKAEVQERPLVSRLTLHASKLAFEHPITKESISIESGLHKDMRALIKQLEKNLG
jgi:RluA family pseudouridine synthase